MMQTQLSPDNRLINQEQVFLDGEARAWFERNKEKLHSSDFVAKDPVLKALRVAKIKPGTTLEIGCADGWRLRSIAAEYDCIVHGIDPIQLSAAESAINRATSLTVHVGTAADWGNCSLAVNNTIIYGFCLYLVDRPDLMGVVKQADFSLLDQGHIVIYDFHHEGPPVRVPYKHAAGVYSYKMDYAKLWLGNPAYTMVHKSVYPTDDGDYTSVTILKKNMGIWGRG